MEEIQAHLKQKFKKLESPITIQGITTQYFIEQSKFIFDITQKEIQISKPELIPIDRNKMIESINLQIMEIKKQKKELLDLE